MADWGQFEDDGTVRGADGKRPAACQVCEAMLPDAVDGLLSGSEQRAFDRHVAGCPVCSRELEEAQRGAAWLGMLKQHAPEPSPALLERILAQTSRTPTSVAEAAVMAQEPPAPAAFAPAAPAWTAATLSRPERKLPSRRTATWARLTGALSLDWMRPVLQPRLAMTAAMAFFSLALTLNLTGVRLRDLHASSFSPASLRRAVTDRSAAAVRSFQNMRVVYQTEAQVHDLRESWQAGRPDQPAPDRSADAPAATPDDRQEDRSNRQPRNPQGSSRLESAPSLPQELRTEQEGA